MRQDRHRDRRIRVNNHGIGQFGRVVFTPTDSLAWGRAGKTASIGSGVSYLDEEILADFLDAEHFLNLRLGLQHEIFGAATAPEDNAAASPVSFCCQHERGGFVYFD